MRYGLNSLLILICVAAALFGVIAQGSLVAFVIGFAVLGLLLMRLMFRRRPGPVVVRETGTNAEAYGLKSFLRDYGVIAEVHPGSLSTLADNSRPPRVMVPPEQAADALELLSKLAEK
jgi:hypothetical protein